MSVLTRGAAWVWPLALLGVLSGSAAVRAAGSRPAGPRPSPAAGAPGIPARPVPHDPRIRVVAYSADRIYRLHGYAGYQIDVQFAPGEHFIGAGVGDTKGIELASAANHLFIKPRTAHVATDLSVLTNRRAYLFDYTASPGPPGRDDPDVIYTLRFEYPRTAARAGTVAQRRARIASDLRAAERSAPRNYDYWYCGAPSLKPQAAWDDGVETYLVFGSRTQLPAVFVRNADGSESLVNFDMRGADMVIQRVARRFVLKRGKLTGCIVNRAFTGSGRRLASGTLSPDVWRVTRTAATAGAADVRATPGARP